MKVDLQMLIESEFDLFKDRHTTKRGPRHRKDAIGLNLNRKHQNVIAATHKSHPGQIYELERLRKLKSGRGVISFNDGEKLCKKYGIKKHSGFLGTTGIKIVKNRRGYLLIKEEVLVENPEFIAGKFRREDFEGYLFIANKDISGLIYSNLNETQTHSELYRAFKHNTTPGKVKSIGDISYDSSFPQFDNSGVLLPKQPYLDGTYISLWTDRQEDIDELKPLIKELINITKAEGPYFLELTDPGTFKSVSVTSYIP